MPTVSGSAALDTAIGLAFLFALLALIASGINEAIAGFLKLRAANLENALRHMLERTDDPGAASPVSMDRMMAQPMLDSLSPEGAKPSYIPSPVFASTLLDMLDLLAPAGPAERDDPVAALTARIDMKLPDGKLKAALQALVREAQGDRDRLRVGVERWYDATMDRVSGWYKRRAQKVLLVIGIVIAVSINADAIGIANTLWTNPSQRAAVVAAAERAADARPTATAGETDKLEAVSDTVGDVNALALPLGWNNQEGDPRNVPEGVGGILLKLAGLLLTAAAIGLGAPFWFDLIGKGASLRAAGRKPPRSQEA